MHDRRLVGAGFIILLLASIISSIYLTFQQKISPKTHGFVKLKKPAIGVVDIYGSIFSAQESGPLMDNSNIQEIIETLMDFREDDKIKAVILRINSPGGSAGAVQEITQEIYRLRAAGKPVVASVSDLAASGGYYIASACDKIVVNAGSVIGSIGVIFMTADMSELMKKVGINIEVVKSGPYKDAGAFYRPVSPEEKKFLQELIDDAYEQFIEEVSKGRDIALNILKKYARGQVYTGRKAKELKLVDELGDIRVAQIKAQELAGIKDSRFVRREYPGWKKLFKYLNNKSFLSNIFGRKKITGLAYIYKP